MGHYKLNLVIIFLLFSVDLQISLGHLDYHKLDRFIVESSTETLEGSADKEIIYSKDNLNERLKITTGNNNETKNNENVTEQIENNEKSGVEELDYIFSTEDFNLTNENINGSKMLSNLFESFKESSDEFGDTVLDIINNTSNDNYDIINGTVNNTSYGYEGISEVFSVTNFFYEENGIFGNGTFDSLKNLPEANILPTKNLDFGDDNLNISRIPLNILDVFKKLPDNEADSLENFEFGKDRLIVTDMPLNRIENFRDLPDKLSELATESVDFGGEILKTSGMPVNIFDGVKELPGEFYNKVDNYHEDIHGTVEDIRDNVHNQITDYREKAHDVVIGTPIMVLPEKFRNKIKDTHDEIHGRVDDIRDSLHDQHTEFRENVHSNIIEAPKQIWNNAKKIPKKIMDISNPIPKLWKRSSTTNAPLDPENGSKRKGGIFGFGR